MKITQTTQCPFCQTALIKRKSSFSYILDCPKQQDHAANTLWYWFDDASNKNKITAINVRVNGYQLAFSLILNTTAICKSDTGQKMLKTFPYLLDFELTKENINHKIKTLLTFI